MKDVVASEATPTFATGAATMGRKRTRRKPLATIWEVPDELWRRIEPILKEFWPRKGTGRLPAHFRRTLNGIIFRMRSGCQWDQLPAKYGPKSTVHGWFQRWAEGGILEKIRAVLVAECEELGGVEWEVAGGRRDAGQGPVRGGEGQARTPPTAGNKAPRSTS
jgi:putative transposase